MPKYTQKDLEEIRKPEIKRVAKSYALSELIGRKAELDDLMNKLDDNDRDERRRIENCLEEKTIIRLMIKELVND